MSPRRRPPEEWPWPTDSPLQRRERIAQAYRDALHRAAPEMAELLDGRCTAWGQTWVLGTRQQLPEDELLTTAQVAELWNVAPRSVDQWRHRDGLPFTETADGVRIRYGDAVAFHQARRAARRPSTRSGASQARNV